MKLGNSRVSVVNCRYQTITLKFPNRWGATVERPYAESHAAAIKHIVIRVEKTIGIVKANLQLKAVTATKQMARAHAMPRMRARVSAGRLLSCHDNTPANTTKTEKKNPNALKKSQ